MAGTLIAPAPRLFKLDLAGRRWHAVVVKPLVQSAAIAVKALEARGWQVLRPMCRELVDSKGQRVEVERPMFGRYVFVGGGREHEPHALRFVPGVQHPVLDGRRRPLVLRPAMLAAIVARLEADGGVADLVPREPEPRFRPGQTVRLLDGPFAGYEGLFQGEVNSRVSVLLSLFGTSKAVTLPAAGIEAASAVD